MRDAKSVGRIVGMLLLVQMAAAPTVNFVLLRPLTTPTGFLANAAGSSFQISLAVLLSFVTGALTLGIAITTFPLFRQYSYRMALWLLALSVAGFSLLAVENATVLSMLSLSQEYAKAGAADAGLFQALGAAVSSARRWAHYTNLFVAGGMVFVFYGVLYRFRLIPRALAAFGLLAGVLQLIAVALPFFGYRIVFLMLMPLGLSHLALLIWLLVKGFDEGHRPLRTEAPAVELPSA
jgi:Domain of unknown function (DUF4386)